MAHQREFRNGAIHIHQRRSKSQRALFGITAQASVSEYQTATQRGHPHLAMLSIFNSLRSGGINQGCICDPTLASSHHFLLAWRDLALPRAPGEGAESGALHLQRAASLHSQPAKVEAAGLQIPSPQGKSTQHKLSQ